MFVYWCCLAITTYEGLARRSELPNPAGEFLAKLRKGALEVYRVQDLETFSRQLKATLMMDKVVGERVCGSISSFIISSEKVTVQTLVPT